MDLIVFSKQCSIQGVINLGLAFKAFQSISHPSYIAHQIYLYALGVPLRLEKMVVVIEIYICMYIFVYLQSKDHT